MRVLVALHPKSKPVNWQRSGDTNMATRMIKYIPEGIDVDVFCDFSDYNQENSYELLRLLDDYGISGTINSAPHIKRRTYLKDSMEYLRSIAEEYDVIHFHNATVASVHWMTEFFDNCDVPLVYTMHTPPDVGASFQWYHRDEYLSFGSNPKNRLVAVSPSHYDRVLKALDQTRETLPSLTYITNGIETELVTPSDEKYDVAVIGRLDATKDILHSLKAARACSPDGKVVYIGDNWAGSTSTSNQEYYDETEKYIEDSGIIWYRSLPNSEVMKVLAASKVHISLSRIETFGLTVAESMMQGTPVIGFNTGGIGDLIVDGETGIKLDVARKKWTTRYREITEEYEKCLEMDRGTVRSTTIDRLDIKNTVSHYVHLYGCLVGSRMAAQLSNEEDTTQWHSN